LSSSQYITTTLSNYEESIITVVPWNTQQ